MNLILFAIIVLQFGYIVFSDIQNRKERKFIQMNLEDFVDFEDTPEESIEEEDDPYLPIEEVGIERIIKAKDKS